MHTSRLLIGALRWSALLLLVLNGVFFLRQPQMTFYPSAEMQVTPAQWGVRYEEVQLLTADKLQLHGWYIPHPAATRTLLFFHGNGGNISHREESLAIFYRQGLNVLIIDYRGYGRSEGIPDEAGLTLDAAAAWQYLIKQRGVPAQQIIIFGRSLGGAVATQLAAEVEPGALILESTFSSAREMAEHLFPLLSNFIFLRYHFDSEAHIRQLKCPLYMAHSPDDEIIPFLLGQKLYAAAPVPKRFFVMRGGHNDGFLQSQPAYERSLQKFISELDSGEGGKSALQQ
jgi:fermentation-respiration switch protein FrsA (DUF1100 family)